MSAAEWSVGAAGPVLRLAASSDPADARWQDFALCRDSDPDLWFAEGQGGQPYREAKAICKRCPVRPSCLEYALEHGERWGLWGGLSEHERRMLLRQRQAAGRERAA